MLINNKLIIVSLGSPFSSSLCATARYSLLKKINLLSLVSAWTSDFSCPQFLYVSRNLTLSLPYIFPVQCIEFEDLAFDTGFIESLCHIEKYCWPWTSELSIIGFIRLCSTLSNSFDIMIRSNAIECMILFHLGPTLGSWFTSAIFHTLHNEVENRYF